ncbi:hypothetical protein NDU88_004612 [Pleurodeles waltl]|uniref:Uncharacterized protein n=1 Tax=Pleurodeles waltl TaxID=8319 RepID=A0AAV7QFS2_PLEWA|nr:hypothetical protein NDU88_004612 [Pleurodeles waltl]
MSKRRSSRSGCCVALGGTGASVMAVPSACADELCGKTGLTVGGGNVLGDRNKSVVARGSRQVALQVQRALGEQHDDVIPHCLMEDVVLPCGEERPESDREERQELIDGNMEWVVQSIQWDLQRA